MYDTCPGGRGAVGAYASGRGLLLMACTNCCGVGAVATVSLHIGHTSTWPAYIGERYLLHAMVSSESGNCPPLLLAYRIIAVASCRRLDMHITARDGG